MPTIQGGGNNKRRRKGKNQIKKDTVKDSAKCSRTKKRKKTTTKKNQGTEKRNNLANPSRGTQRNARGGARPGPVFGRGQRRRPEHFLTDLFFFSPLVDRQQSNVHHRGLPTSFFVIITNL